MALTFITNRSSRDHPNSIPFTHNHHSNHHPNHHPNHHQNDRSTTRERFLRPRRYIASISTRKIKPLQLFLMTCLFIILTISLMYKTTNNPNYLNNPKIPPRIMALHFNHDNKIQYEGPLQHLYSHTNSNSLHQDYASNIAIDETRSNIHQNKDYADPLVRGECVQQYDWQLLSFPTCNLLHEHDLLHSTSTYLDRGHYRDVWSITKPSIQIKSIQNPKQHETMIFKSLRYKYELDDRNLDRNRKDALAMERLTFSNYILDIYAYCANAGLYEYANQGTLNARIKQAKALSNTTDPPDLTPDEKITIAVQVASALTDAHHSEHQNQAAFTHGDIKADQFLNVNGVYKLNDFNRGRLLAWNLRLNQPCQYKVGNNGGSNRSPEEYKYKGQDEKIDVYSMGNIFYYLVTLEKPFHDDYSDEAQTKITTGRQLSIDNRMIQHPIDDALKRAMQMCHVYNPRKRASARDVLDFLEPFQNLYT